MSVQAITWALGSGLPCPERMVLVVLANFANQDDESYPAQKTIADKSGLTRPAVNRILGRLEQKGWLSIIPRRHDTGADRSYLYKLNVPEQTKGASQVPTKPVVGFVYVAETGALRKIGIARNVETRMRGLSAQCGIEVRAVKYFEMEMKDARAVEEAALEALAEFRTKGEWVSCSAAVAVKAVEKSLGVVCPRVTPPCNGGAHPGVSPEHTLNLHLNEKEEPTHGRARDPEGRTPVLEVRQPLPSVRLPRMPKPVPTPIESPAQMAARIRASA